MAETREPVKVWSPPDPAERILGVTRWRDLVLIACTEGLYVIGDDTQAIIDLKIQRIRS